MNPHAYLFVDGSSSRKDDVGAWAAIAATVTQRKILYGMAYPTTISRMELSPIIAGLHWMKKNWSRESPGFRITVYSDSEYTVKTLCGLYPRHKNDDLWKAYDEAAKGLHIKFIWRERNSLDYMEMCDGICNSIRRIVIDSLTKAVGDARNLEQLIPFSALPEETEKV
jgi:ribonuclease HI